MLIQYTKSTHGYKRQPTRVPTPVEIRTAINAALIEDADNPDTPHVPAHVGGLIREAIARANRGEFA